MVRCVNGEVQLAMQCAPMFDYGRQRPSWSYVGDGYHVAVADGADDVGQPRLTLTTDMRLGFEGPRAAARTMMKEGETRFVALSWSKHEPPATFDDAYRRLVW